MRILGLPANFVKFLVGSKRSLFLAVAVVSVMAILVVVSIFVARRSSAHGVNPAKKKPQGCCSDQPAVSRRMIGTYYTTEDGFQSTLILNNKGPNQIVVTPILHSQNGQTFTASLVAVGGQSSSEVDLNLLASIAGPQFRSGSFEFTYEGRLVEVGGGLRIVNSEKSLIFDEQMLEPGMKFPSSQLEAVYAIPFRNSQVSVIVTNITAQPILVNGDAIFAGANGHHPIRRALGPHETQVINLPHGLVKKASAGAVSLSHNGVKGAMLAKIHLWDADRGYSETVNFANPVGKTTERHGAGFRLGSVDNDPLGAVIAVRNIGESTTTVTATVPYSKQNGDTGTIALPQVSLAPGAIKLLNTSNPQLRRNDFATAGLEVKYTGAPGSVIASASSVSQSGNHVFALPMKDPKGGLSSSGGYPWFINESSSTVVFIKNTTEKPQDFILSVIYPGGSWGLIHPAIPAGQTIEVDVRKLRDSQQKGVGDSVIPPDAVSGHISWGARGTVEKVLIGRAQTVDFARGMAATYECACPCVPSWTGNTRMSPENPTLFQGEQITIVPEAEYVPCFGGFPQWFQVTSQIHALDLTTSSGDPLVVTYSPSFTATANDEGSVFIGAEWTDQVVSTHCPLPCFPANHYEPDPEPCPTQCECNATFPLAAASTTVTVVKMDITFGDTGQSLTQGVKTVIAGQKIDLRLKPANATNISWTVPGVRLKDWKVTHTPGSTVSTAEVIPVGDLNTNNAVFYWADGTLPGVSKEVSVTAHVAGKARTKKAVFNLVKPEAIPIVTHQGEIKVVSSVIKYGLAASGDLPGIKFEKGSPLIPDGFSGSTQWVQLLRSDREAIDPTGTFRDQRIGNDRRYPYSTDSITFDSPSQVLASNTQRMAIADRFSMYLMFQPNIAGSIWVPLKKIDWGWNVVVVPTTFSWRIESQSKTGPFITTTAEHHIWDKNILGPVFTPVP